MPLPAKKLNPEDIVRDGPSLREILLPVSGQLSKVEEVLQAVSSGQEGILKDSSRYVLAGGGKRIRAAIVLFCQSAGTRSPGAASDGCADNSAISIAASVELVHAATLVHDDIIDRSLLRRLKPTVAVKFGEGLAVLLGDYLYAKAFDMIAEVGDKEITSWISSSTRVICEGEIQQLGRRYATDVDLGEYISFIEKKTASLISLCARVGARLGGRNPKEQESLATYGLNLGISFQIVDDILDLFGSENKTGKTLYTDVINGKMTLPLILLARSLDGEEKNKFIAGFRDGSLDMEFLRPLLVKHDIQNRSQVYADDYRARALRELQGFHTSLSAPLADLSCFILKRDC